MSSHASVGFRRELDALFRRRTAWLHASVAGPRPGRPQALSRSHVKNTVARLQDLASEALADKLARKEFLTGVSVRKRWYSKKGNGRGVENKQRSFNAWFKRQFKRGTYIYVFWKGRRCVYIGKTTKSGRRISGHFVKHWFSSVTRVDVYKANGRRVLPALECLAIHRFQPMRNKVRAERRKWTRKCELCRVHRSIKKELGQIFRLR